MFTLCVGEVLLALVLTIPGTTGLSVSQPTLSWQRTRLADGEGSIWRPLGAEGTWLQGPFEDAINNASNARLPFVPESNKTASEITGITLNGEGDTAAMLSAVALSSVGVVWTLVFFSLLRQCHPVLYARINTVDSSTGSIDKLSAAPGDAEEAPGRGGSGLQAIVQDMCGWLSTLVTSLDWLWMVVHRDPEEEVEAAGLDGWALVEFHRLIFKILTRIGPVILVVLIPVHYLEGQRLHISDFISRLDVANLPDGSALWWLHAVLVWFVVGVSTWLISSAHEDFTERRFKWLQMLPAPQAKTVLVEHIPMEYCTDAALKAYFEKIFWPGSVERAYMVRRTQELRQSVEEFDKLKYRLVLMEESHRQGGHKNGEEGIERLRSELARVREIVIEERSRIEDACRGDEAAEDGKQGIKPWTQATSSGFVTFTDQLTQRLAEGRSYRKDATEVTVSMAEEPQDVLYDDLEDAASTAYFEFLGWACLILLFLCWSPMVVFISSWTTLSTIKEYIPLVDRWCTELPQLNSLLEGVLASAALKLFLAFLPTILLGIIRSFFNLKYGAWAQLQLERWYFAFLTIFVLLVTILGRSMVITAAVLLQQPTEIIDLLARSLPGASHFYFSYIIVGWFTQVFELIRISNLCKYCFYRVVHKLPCEQAKEYAEPEDPGSYGMGTRFAVACLVAAITFVFCTCSPLVLLFAWVYFFAGWITYGHLLTHVEAKKPDLGGRFWMEAMTQVFFALVVFVLLMTGVLAAHGGSRKAAYISRFGPSFVAVCALPLLWRQWRKLNRFTWQLPLQVLHEGHFTPQKGEQYAQRECTSDLDLS